MNKPDKNFDTGLRIMEVLKILLEKDVSKNELIARMNKNPDFENVYTFEAFIKYFNTLSILGFEIEKSKNLYKLKNAFEKITLSSQECEVLIDLIEYTKKLHNKKLEKTIKNLIYKSVKYLDKESQEQVISALKKSAQNIHNNENIADSLESLMYDGLLVTVTYVKKNNIQDTITVEIKEIIEKNGEIVLVCYDRQKARNKRINVSSIVLITQMPSKASTDSYKNDAVIFRVYGRLAELYKLKPGETTIDFSAGYLTISNSGEDRELLLKRLLKYGENCKIVKPQSLRDELLNLTDEMLKNLEEELI